MKKCERCGEADGQTVGNVMLCDKCVILICLEWSIRRQDFAELSQ